MTQSGLKIAGLGIIAAFMGLKTGGDKIPKNLGKQIKDGLKNALTGGSSPEGSTGSPRGERMSATEALGSSAAADIRAKISEAFGRGKDGGKT